MSALTHDPPDVGPSTAAEDWPRLPGLAGKVALVTGGSRGLGAATCRALAANGVRVAVGGRDEAAIDTVVRDITTRGGTALATPGSLAGGDPTVLREIRRRTEDALGPVDILAPFAGGAGAPTPTVELSLERWHEVMATDLTSVFATVREFLPGMTARGSGTVVLMSSTAGRQPGGANAAYAVAKAGVVMLGRHLAAEVGPSGVRVACVAPSAVDNPRLRAALSEEQRAELAGGFPLRRIGQPEDVAHAVLYLASGAASWVTGVTLDVAGGRVIA